MTAPAVCTIVWEEQVGAPRALCRRDELSSLTWEEDFVLKSYILTDFQVPFSILNKKYQSKYHTKAKF